MDRNINHYPNCEGTIKIHSTPPQVYHVDNIRRYAKFHFRAETAHRAHISIPPITYVPHARDDINSLTHPYPDLFTQ